MTSLPGGAHRALAGAAARTGTTSVLASIARMVAIFFFMVPPGDEFGLEGPPPTCFVVPRDVVSLMSHPGPAAKPVVVRKFPDNGSGHLRELPGDLEPAHGEVAPGDHGHAGDAHQAAEREGDLGGGPAGDEAGADVPDVGAGHPDD